ncbi:MAG: type I R/M system specificity subunit [FCB group bacterium]|nr:type I R/M system specificity subunit [FCB group bacterium]
MKRIEGWDYVTISEICETITDYVANGSFASLKENVKYLKERAYAILIRVTDYSKGFNGPFIYIDKHAYEFLRKTKVFEGDIIVGNVGSIGLAFEAPKLDLPLSIAPNALLVRSKARNRFLFFLLLSPLFQNHIRLISTKSAQPKFNKTQFRNIVIPYPPLPELFPVSLIRTSWTCN